MIKVEFKLSVPNGQNAYVEKMIESQEDYENFKNEVSGSIKSLDDIISHQIQLKEKNHDNSGSNSENTSIAVND